MLNGIPQKPIEGISFADTFGDAKAKGRRTTQYFEMGCARGIYQDGWVASSNPVVPWNPHREAYDIDKVKWELYHIDKDFSQANDLAKANPEKLRQLQDLWWVEASKHNVLPLDFRGTERLNAELQGRPSLGGNAKTLTYYPGQVGLSLRKPHITMRVAQNPARWRPRPRSNGSHGRVAAPTRAHPPGGTSVDRGR